MKILCTASHVNSHKLSKGQYCPWSKQLIMDTVVSDINNFLSQVIGQNVKKLIFYYGATDHWAPVSYYEDMKNKFPEGEIYLCERKFKHAFVLESSEEVAEMVALWIQGIIVQGGR